MDDCLAGRVVIDLDDCLSDLVGEVLRRLEAARDPAMERAEVRSYDYAEAFGPKWGSVVRSWLEDRGFYCDLPVLEGAKEAVAWLEEAGYTVDFVTKPFRADSYWAKNYWLSERITRCPVLYTAATPQERANLCWDPRDILIDDNPANLAAWPGLRVLYLQPWNSNPEVLDQLRPVSLLASWDRLAAVIKLAAHCGQSNLAERKTKDENSTHRLRDA